jgi:hypothetical protein
VAWSNVLHTLCAGGCLCVASAEDLLNNLDACIDRFQVTIINITPTVLQTLTPRRSSLDNILLSGETPSFGVLSRWADLVRLKNTYGEYILVRAARVKVSAAKT